MIHIYKKLRDKNFPVSSVCSAQFCDHAFFIHFGHLQCKEFFGNIPRGFNLSDDGIQLSLFSDVTNDEFIARAREILKLADKALAWVDKLPTLSVLGFVYSYSSRDEAEKIHENLLRSKIGFKLNVQERSEADYILYGFRYINSDDEETEIEKLRSLGGENCNDFSANVIIDF